MTTQDTSAGALPASVKSYARYLLIMAGLGGLLYGVDVGIIAAALPYIEETTNYTQAQLSQVVAAVLFGSVLSSLFAGLLSDLCGRKPIILLSALLFSLSIPVICFSGDSFGLLMGGRILQGASAGLIGVVVPLYLAECLGADSRGKGTGMFQFLLTVGLVFAALIGIFTTNHVDSVMATKPPAEVIHATKVHAWQLIFWISIIPGIILFIGGFKLSESPRWLYRRGMKEEALTALARNNGIEKARIVFEEMERVEEEERQAAEAKKAAKDTSSDSIFHRKYIIPFTLAVIILACNQATGINSVLNYSVKIFQQAGLEGIMSNYGDTALKIVNCIMTVVAVSLVDKKGRKFLLKLGTSGVIIGLAGAATLFLMIEKDRTDITPAVSKLINTADKSFRIDLEETDLSTLGMNGDKNTMQLIITYEQGGASNLAVADCISEIKGEKSKSLINVKQKEVEKGLGETMLGWVGLGEPEIKGKPAEIQDIKITKAEWGHKPSEGLGWSVAIFFIIFIAFYAVGPGVCVWLALSELMPTRIRSNGMAIALLINQGVSTTIAGVFLPWVGAWGYSGVFYTLAGCTVIYFITAAFFLPETKGRTLEEIEEYFTNGKMPEEPKALTEKN